MKRRPPLFLCQSELPPRNEAFKDDLGGGSWGEESSRRSRMPDRERTARDLPARRSVRHRDFAVECLDERRKEHAAHGRPRARDVLERALVDDNAVSSRRVIDDIRVRPHRALALDDFKGQRGTQQGEPVLLAAREMFRAGRGVGKPSRRGLHAEGREDLLHEGVKGLPVVRGAEGDVKAGNAGLPIRGNLVNDLAWRPREEARAVLQL